MNVGLRTLELKIHDIPEVKYAWDTGRHQGLEKIAKSAFEGAMEGDTTLIIFLCKTRLHWSEKPEATSDSKQINIYLPEALSEEKWNERIRNSNGTKISAQEETTG